jgi:hypothetical protein
MPESAFDINRQVALGEALGGFERLTTEKMSAQPTTHADASGATAEDDAGAWIVPAHFDTAQDAGDTWLAAETGAATPAVSERLTEPVPVAGPLVLHGFVGSDDAQTQSGVGWNDHLETGALFDDSNTPWTAVFASAILALPSSICTSSATTLPTFSGSPAPAHLTGNGLATASQDRFAVFSDPGAQVSPNAIAPGNAGPSAPAGFSLAESKSGLEPTDTPHPIAPSAILPGGVITEASIGPGGATAAQVQLALDESGLSVNGAGIKVGVLSDSFNDLAGAAVDESDGALPTARHIQVLSDLASGGSDEGRAMMQVIHDIAPGADLAFYTAFNSEHDFAHGILALATAGCKVICDDVSYIDEPFFQNGIVAQAIQQVEAEGVTYVTAAGNDASNGYQASWTPSSGTFDHISLTDAETFGGGSLVQTVTINNEGTGSAIPLVLEWDQAYDQATSDMELLVFRNGHLVGTAAGAFSGEPTNPWLEYNFTQSSTYQIAIENLHGPDPGLIKEVTQGDGLVASISGANSGTVIGHAMTPGAITAAAVDAAETPAFGVNPPASESFSSSGAGTELLFDNNGNRLALPDVLSPIAVSGLDDIRTTVSGSLSDFYGTSAASASLAGVAALILQADPNLTSGQVEQLMQETALPMDNSAVSGAGLVQVGAAVAAAVAAAPPFIVSTDTNSYGSVSLVERGGDYLLDRDGASGPVLKYGGSPVTLGELGGWTPIGAAATANGYDVAWKLLGANEYTVWTVDSSGNFFSDTLGAVLGKNLSLQVLELTFNQNLNGDGRIGPPHTDFVFDSALTGSVKRIAHFNPSVDRIVLSVTDFPDLRHISGVLAAGEFHIGPHATTAAQRILYHPATGYIDYHVPGGGPNGLIHFAHVSPHLALTHVDFLVVA